MYYSRFMRGWRKRDQEHAFAPDDQVIAGTAIPNDCWFLAVAFKKREAEMSPHDRSSKGASKVVSRSGRSSTLASAPSASVDNPHRANRVLAALNLADFGILEPHLHLVEL